MNLNQIYSFIAITKTLNFTAAARQLGIPQSTISRQVNDLEGLLGVKLFYRTKRDVTLTDEGKTFLPFAKEIIEAAEKGTKAVKELHDGSTGHLSIAVVPACEQFVCRCLDSFHHDYPDIAVDIKRISAGYVLMDDIEAGSDFYFIYRDMLATGDEHDHMITHREPVAVSLTRSLSKKKDKEILKELPSCDFMLVSEESDPILYMQAMNYCRTRRFTPRIANSFNDISSLMLTLRSDMGVSFLPVSVAGGGSEDALPLLALDEEDYSITCVAAWKRSLLNPAAKLFRDTIKKQAAPTL